MGVGFPLVVEEGEEEGLRAEMAGIEVEGVVSRVVLGIVVEEGLLLHGERVEVVRREQGGDGDPLEWRAAHSVATEVRTEDRVRGEGRRVVPLLEGVEVGLGLLEVRLDLPQGTLLCLRQGLNLGLRLLRLSFRTPTLRAGRLVLAESLG